MAADGSVALSSTNRVGSSASLLVVQTYGGVHGVAPDGRSLWSWSARPPTDGPQLGAYQVVEPAQFLEVTRDGVVVLLDHRVAFLDGQTGKELAAGAEVTWELDSLEDRKGGRVRAYATSERVYIPGAQRPGFEGAELFGCRDGDVGYIRHRDGQVSVELGKGRWDDHEKNPVVRGRILSHFVDEENRPQAVWVSGERAFDDRSCYDLAPLGVGRRFVRATHAAVTADGILFVATEHDRTIAGDMGFYSFADRRDVSPCRRLTFRPVLPDTDSGDAPAENLEDAPSDESE